MHITLTEVATLFQHISTLNQSLVFAGNSEVLKKYAEIWSRIQGQIKEINSGKSGEYGKDYMIIKFNSDDLSLNKQLNFINLTIIVRSVFEENYKYHPQIFLDECFMNYKNATV